MDDGSTPPPLFPRSVTDVIRHRRRVERGLEVDEVRQRELMRKYWWRLHSPLGTLRVLLDLASATILIETGLGLGLPFPGARRWV